MYLSFLMFALIFHTLHSQERQMWLGLSHTYNAAIPTFEFGFVWVWCFCLTTLGSLPQSFYYANFALTNICFIFAVITTKVSCCYILVFIGCHPEKQKWNFVVKLTNCPICGFIRTVSTTWMWILYSIFPLIRIVADFISFAFSVTYWFVYYKDHWLKPL